MNFTELILSAITASGFVGAALFLARNWIITRLQNSVKHEYDKRLEVFKDDLNAKSKEISALREYAFSGLTSANGALAERRIKAVEQIWQAIQILAPARNVVRVMSVLNVKEIEKDQGHKTASGQALLEQVFEMSGRFELKNLPKSEATLAQPFVSPLAWSLYAAYSAIVFRGCIQLQLLKGGIDTKYIHHAHIMKLVEAAMPHKKDILARSGLDAAYYMLEEIETMLLDELRKVARGETDDAEGVRRAGMILNAVHSLTADTEKLRNGDPKDV